MPWGAAISAVASIGTGLIGADATKSAAKTQADAANNATEMQRGIYNQTTQNLSPFLQGGTAAFGDLQKMLGIGSAGGPTSPVLQMLGIGGPGGTGGTGSINPATFQGSPGYQYQQQQGQEAVTNSAAANGGLGGNALRALLGVGQQLGNQGWQQYLGNVGNAWQQQIGNVSGVANMGQNAAVKQGGFGEAFGAQAGTNTIGAGNAMAAGQVGGANAMTGGFTNALQAILTQMQGGGGGGGGGMDLFSGGGPFSANSLNSTFGTQFGSGTFPSASNPNATVPGYQADNFTPIG